MDDDKKEILKNKGYEVENITKCLGLSPEEAERIEEIILKARLEWIMDNS